MKTLCIMGLATGMALSGPAAHASVLSLDWNTAKQGPLARSGHSYTDLVNVDGGKVKLTVAPTGPVTLQKFGKAGVQTPAVTNTIFEGGQAPGTSNLSAVAKFTRTKANQDPSVTFTISFLGFEHGVSDVNFNLFDVDSSDHARFVDEVTFQTAGVSLVSGKDNVLIGDNTVAGTAPASNVGTGSGAGNVGVTYARLPSDSIVFTYRNLGRKATSVQGIGIGNISFVPVPEVHQLIIGLAACALGAFWLRQRGRRKAVGAA